MKKMRLWPAVMVCFVMLLMALTFQTRAGLEIAQDLFYRGRLVVQGLLDVTGTQTVSGTLNVTGAQTVSGSLDCSGTFTLDSTAVTATATELNKLDASGNYTTHSVTNGKPVTLTAASPYVFLNGIGGANDTTNTITLALPYPVGCEWTLIVASGSTNLIALADSTTVVALGTNWVGDATDTLRLYSVATNVLVKLSASDN